MTIGWNAENALSRAADMQSVKHDGTNKKSIINIWRTKLNVQYKYKYNNDN